MAEIILKYEQLRVLIETTFSASYFEPKVLIFVLKASSLGNGNTSNRSSPFWAHSLREMAILSSIRVSKYILCCVQNRIYIRSRLSSTLTRFISITNELIHFKLVQSENTNLWGSVPVPLKQFCLFGQIQTS